MTMKPEDKKALNEMLKEVAKFRFKYWNLISKHSSKEDADIFDQELTQVYKLIRGTKNHAK